MRSKTQNLHVRKDKWIRLFLMFAIATVLAANSLVIKSSLVGTITCLGFLSVISVVIGDIFYQSENLLFKCLFGLTTFLLLLAASGFGLMFIGKFTEFYSAIVIIMIGVFFGVISLLKREGHSQNLFKNSSETKAGKTKDLYSYLIVLLFLSYVAVALGILFLARTGEGGASVWEEIHPFFIPVFAISTLILSGILFFSSVGDNLKLVLLSVYTFLAHSLFLIVWYPSRYGDPLKLLGHARYTARTGTIYALNWLTSNFLVSGIISYRAQFALTIFFERMFSIDIYWVHIVIVPILWSIFVPCLAYRLAELLTRKKSSFFPLLAALSTAFFSSLILWGAVSVPNALGFVFLFLSAVLLLKWMKSGGKWNWFISLLAVGVTVLTHPQPGLFALVLFLWINVIQMASRKIIKVASLLLTCAIYPVVLYLNGASFSAEGLFLLDNFISFQSETTIVLFAFGLIGLILGIRSNYVNAKDSVLFFGFNVTVLFEYYLTKFGMTNIPYGPGRVLVIGDLFLVPFVALGILVIIDLLGKAVGKGKENISFELFSMKAKVILNSRSIGLALICLVATVQATSTLYQAYPHEEAVEYQPSAYIVEAVHFIDADASSRYIVLCDPIIASVAVGFLGIDYAYGAARGAFGMPDWEYPLMKMYWDMTKQPSINIIQSAMIFRNASIGYFAVWKGHARYESIVEQTSEILPLYRSFDSTLDGKPALWVFRYPLPTVTEPGPPVKVIFDDGVSEEYVETSFEYMFETMINSTITLSGHTSYNITGYPLHWTFLDLTVNNSSWKFDEASEVDKFVYVKGLNLNDVLTVKWQWNRNYSSAVWKEDSFKYGWRVHDVYTGTITPAIVTDGNILNLSYNFAPGPYSYYYYIKTVNITTATNQSIIVRWRADSPVAVIAYYFELGLTSAAHIIPMGSESSDWRVSSLELPSNLKITHVMVGINNLKARDLSGVRTLSVDYILIATSI